PFPKCSSWAWQPVTSTSSSSFGPRRRRISATSCSNGCTRSRRSAARGRCCSSRISIARRRFPTARRSEDRDERVLLVADQEHLAVLHALVHDRRVVEACEQRVVGGIVGAVERRGRGQRRC